MLPGGESGACRSSRRLVPHVVPSLNRWDPDTCQAASANRSHVLIFAPNERRAVTGPCTAE